MTAAGSVPAVGSPVVVDTRLASALLAWGEAHRRDLPWRRTRDAWAVLVSETMLAQTQVTRVAPAWEAFLRRWPDAPATAAAPVGEIITAWAGLGYYRRAVQLHRAATVITDRYGGRVPDDLDALLALPGVGPYTARAVLAFAYDRDVGVLDTNAARVLARAAAGRRLQLAEARRLADDLVPAGRGWAWNQTVLDLGATVCTARRPRCGACPLAGAGCAWASAGAAGGADPAVGSAGTSGRQAAFAGSDRQGRGQLVAALQAGSLSPADLAVAAGWPDDPDRARRVAHDLVSEGLAARTEDGGWRLPGKAGEQPPLPQGRA